MRQLLSYKGVVSERARYGVGELAELGGVSRRTVRYYVQEGLLPSPYGLGRGDHYGAAHLERLLQIKAWQEAGQSLDGIRRALSEGTGPREQPAPPRGVYRRLTLAHGVELHVSGAVGMPSPDKLTELAAWCRLNFAARPAGDEENDHA
jgi:DNA-binding transcriptional MerR regulator